MRRSTVPEGEPEEEPEGEPEGEPGTTRKWRDIRRMARSKKNKEKQKEKKERKQEAQKEEDLKMQVEQFDIELDDMLTGGWLDLRFCVILENFCETQYWLDLMLSLWQAEHDYQDKPGEIHGHVYTCGSLSPAWRGILRFLEEFQTTEEYRQRCMTSEN